MGIKSRPLATSNCWPVYPTFKFYKCMIIPSARASITVKPFSDTFPNSLQLIVRTARVTELRKRTPQNISLIESLDLILILVTYLMTRTKKTKTCLFKRLLQTTSFRGRPVPVQVAVFMSVNKTIMPDQRLILWTLEPLYKMAPTLKMIKTSIEIFVRKFSKNSDICKLFATITAKW